jgi:hypothetical protein
MLHVIVHRHSSFYIVVSTYCNSLKAQLAEFGIVCRAGSIRPMKLAVFFIDWYIVDRCMTLSHKAISIKFPIFVSMRAEPFSGLVMILVTVTNGDAVVGKGPQLLDQTIVKLSFPFSTQEIANFPSAFDKVGSIPPDGVFCVRHFDLVGVLGVPTVFGQGIFCMAVSLVKGGNGGLVSVAAAAAAVDDMVAKDVDVDRRWKRRDVFPRSGLIEYMG